MSYKDRYSITEIEINQRIPNENDLSHDAYQRLSLSMDEGEGLEIVPFILYVPDTTKFKHYHIVLTDKGLKDLYEWLKEYHEDKQLSWDDIEGMKEFAEDNRTEELSLANAGMKSYSDGLEELDKI